MTTSGWRSRIGACAFSLLAGTTLVASPLAATPDKPATNVSDLRNYFASCFQPPSAGANTRVTFYFSLNSHGGVIGQPRTTWLGFTGTEQEKEKRLGQFTDAFDKCLPVSLDREMSATMPGEVYFLQYVVGPDGHDQQVLFRPFGSHGIGPAIGEGIGPAPGLAEAPGRVGPTIRPFRTFRPHPGEGPFFHPPIVLPFGRHRDR